MSPPADEHEHARAEALDRAIASARDRLATPALVIDLDAVDHNVAAMLRRTGDPSAWRPHVKTVKQSTIVGALLDAGVHRFKAATPDEVDLILSTAATRALSRPLEVLLAYPAAPPQLHAMVVLRRRHPTARLGLLADAPEHAHALARQLGNPVELEPFDLWLDVDIGMHRTGSPPDHWRTAALPRCQWLRPVGLHGYDGHLSWSATAEAHRGYDALVELARALPFDVEQLVTSGTHSYANALAHPGLREGPWSHQVSPGTIVLSDRRSTEAAADLGLRQAAFVATRVVALPGDDRVTLDAGSKAIAPDCPPPGCAILGKPELVPLRASEEHRPTHVTSGPRPIRGSLLWLVPDHVCTTVNLHADALYVRGDTIVGSASVEARGHRPWLRLLSGLALAASLTGTTACQPITRDLPVQLILPPQDSDLDRTNNVSLILQPDGFTETIATDGLDFALTFELPPDQTVRTLAVFMADSDTLLAWGETPPFSLSGASDGLSLLMARPGRLTPLDLDFSTPDPDALVATVSNRGALVVSSDGGTVFLDISRYTIAAGTTLEDPPAATDGVLVGAADGGVIRLAWNEGLAAWRFDVFANEWNTVELTGDLQPRPGAAAWLVNDRESIRLFGGGVATDVVEIPLRGGDARSVDAVAGLSLDTPRPGATVVLVDGTPLVVGGNEPDAEVVWQPQTERSGGPTTPWHSMDCGQVSIDPPVALCAGGIREDQPSDDVLRIEVDGDTIRAESFDARLPVALPNPRVTVDSNAVYAQGAGRWFRIEGDDPIVSEPPGLAPRAEGGDEASFPNGLTLWVGGRDVDGVALARWSLFTRQPTAMDSGEEG